jgi:hypothetical protein
MSSPARPFSPRKTTKVVAFSELMQYSREVEDAALEPSTKSAHRSADNLYSFFIDKHFPKSQHPAPSLTTVRLYLSWLSIHKYSTSTINQALAMFARAIPDDEWASISNSRTHQRFLRGIFKIAAKQAVTRARAIGVEEILLVFSRVNDRSHDDALFLVICLLGFFCLHRLGELAWSAGSSQEDSRIPFSSVKATRSSLEYSKSSRGRSHQVAMAFRDVPAWANSSQLIQSYTSRRSHLDTQLADFLVREDGTRPPRDWFLARLRDVLDCDDISGHSLRAGGTTFCALLGYSEDIIKRRGRWSSQSWELYVRDHPLLVSCSADADFIRLACLSG